MLFDLVSKSRSYRRFYEEKEISIQELRKLVQLARLSPSAYIIMLRDKSISTGMTMDEGICAQSIFLGAADMGFGGCFIGAVNRSQLSGILNLEDNLEISLVIALGYPKEEVVLEVMNEEGDFKYYRDENEVHHVPKRSLEELVIEEIEN
jgi:nitroreductase